MQIGENGEVTAAVSREKCEKMLEEYEKITRFRQTQRKKKRVKQCKTRSATREN